MTSFAWGLAPSSARAQAPLAELGGCTVSDLLWTNNLSLMTHLDKAAHTDSRKDVARCDTECPVSLVPRLLLRELVVSVARRMLPDNDTIITVPRVSVNSARSSKEFPPKLWMVSITVCFPCDGTPVARCILMTAVLDAEHIEQSYVSAATDAGVVPAEEAVSGGTLPFNARWSELST